MEPNGWPGRLLETIGQVSQLALASGHLVPYATQPRTLDQQGMTFAIRMLEPQIVKPMALASSEPTSATRPVANPFLPYEPRLFVGQVTDDYVGLLNKFMVVPNHLLLVTRDFESQVDRLAARDFEALAWCHREAPGLGFYNGGRVAGASQPHRHLQWIPLPMLPDGCDTPLSPWFRRCSARVGFLTAVPGLPFHHHFARLDAATLEDPRVWASHIGDLYDEACRRCGWKSISADTPYNLLITRDWFLFVPRRAECFAGISLNAMAFVGGLLVRGEAEWEALQAAGPLTALIETSGYDPIR